MSEREFKSLIQKFGKDTIKSFIVRFDGSKPMLGLQLQNGKKKLIKTFPNVTSFEKTAIKYVTWFGQVRIKNK